MITMNNTKLQNDSPYPDETLRQLRSHMCSLKSHADWLIKNTNPVFPMYAVAESLTTVSEIPSSAPKYFIDWLRDAGAALEEFTDDWRRKKLKAFHAGVISGEVEHYNTITVDDDGNLVREAV